MISQSRWENLLHEVECCLRDCKDDYLISRSEINVLMSVLKSNTPFQVVPDCCVNKTPNEVTVAAMNDVLLETENFKVLGDKE